MFLFVQIGVAAWGWFLWRHIPSPGWAVAILAGVAATMSVHGDMRGWQKAIWMGLIGLLLIIELRAISKDRTDSDTKASAALAAQDSKFQAIRDTQDEDFKATADGLKNAYLLSQEQFTATMNGMGGILTREESTLRQTLGGDGYPEFVPSFPIDGSNQMPVLVIASARSWAKSWPQGHIPTPEETAPLPDVSVDVSLHPIHGDKLTPQDMINMADSMLHPTHYNLGTLMAGQVFTAPFKLELGRRYTLAITTRRGWFREEIHMDRDASPGGWKISICIYGRRTIYNHKSVTTQDYLLSGHCD
jgi:hypothetical protein